MIRPYAITCLCAGFLASYWRGQTFDDFSTLTPIAQQDVLVLGFMGGRDSWNNARVGVGRLAKRLREMHLPGIHVETVENRKRGLALELVRRAFDRNRDGKLDLRERESARVILYGQSFGGAAVVKFARQLKALGVPVMLTVQVDSVGLNDEVIPSNVVAAANLFQRDGFFVHGAGRISAEDPRATEIIGNFSFSYRDRAIDLSGIPWHKKVLRKDHASMDLDPQVWRKVEELILLALARGRTR